MNKRARKMTGSRVLLVEDEYFIVEDMIDAFVAHGAEIIGPAANVRDALALVSENERIDAAVIDINLCGEMAFPVADALLARGVPFVFATGYDKVVVPDRYANVKHCEKPISADQLADVLLHMAR